VLHPRRYHRCEGCPGNISFLSQEKAELEKTEKENKLIRMKYKIAKDRLNLKVK
jgi:hypothetical protein